MAKAVIRTSDRIAFKRCRRKWALSSSLRRNLTGSTDASYFWIGKGGHFALEDYHGYNKYGHPAEAFKAYVEAWKRVIKASSKAKLPDDWQEQAELGVALMDSYVNWLETRDPLETLWVDGVPQCEVNALIKLPIEHPLYDEGVFYSVTLDRVVWYEGELWLQDYKFYKSLSSDHLDIDQQMSAYVWAGSVLYEGFPIKGAILQQHLKKIPNPPRILKCGDLSTAKNQGTTHRLYKAAIEQKFGSVDDAPSANVDLLNNLAAEESEHRDNYIRRDFSERTPAQLKAAGEKILMELEDMLNPDLPLYPNETRDCSWDCSFQEVCGMMDRNDDWEYVLAETTIQRDEEDDNWRNHLP